MICIKNRNQVQINGSFLGCTAIVHKGCKESVPPCLKVGITLIWFFSLLICIWVSVYTLQQACLICIIIYRNFRINTPWWRTKQRPSHRVSSPHQGLTVWWSNSLNEILSFCWCSKHRSQQIFFVHRFYSERQSSSACDPHFYLSTCYEPKGEEGHCDPVVISFWKFAQQWQVKQLTDVLRNKQ